MAELATVARPYAEAAFKLASEQNDAVAQNLLGGMYERGQGVPKDDNEAARLYKLSADLGNAQGQFSLARFYQAGRGGLPVDPAAATKLLQLAAAQGHAGAKRELDEQASAASPQAPPSSGSKQ